MPTKTRPRPHASYNKAKGTTSTNRTPWQHFLVILLQRRMLGLITPLIGASFVSNVTNCSGLLLFYKVSAIWICAGRGAWYCILQDERFNKKTLANYKSTKQCIPGYSRALIIQHYTTNAWPVYQYIVNTRQTVHIMDYNHYAAVYSLHTHDLELPN